MDKFRIHSIALVKNEADIVRYCLEEALKWSDFIYVYDGASTDGTLEILRSMQSDRIILFKSDGCVFRESLRADVFNAYRHLAREGDWWCQLNVDEFYVDDPRVFLSTVPPSCHVVWGLIIQYYLTPQDLDKIDFSQRAEKLLPQIRYYKVDCAERRFFRYRSRLIWPDDSAWPKHLGLAHKELIRFRHYPYRSPQQIQMRLDVRRDNRARGFCGWEHAKEACWREKLVSPQQLQFDRGNDEFVVDPRRIPNYRGSWPRRLVQRLMHGVGIWP